MQENKRVAFIFHSQCIYTVSHKKVDPFSFEHNWQILSDFNNFFSVADRN